MLNEKDHINCKKVLKLLSLEDLLSLKNTVTNGKIATSTRREAIDLIVEYSKTPEELFQRRKMTRDILFKFLHNEGQRIPPSTDKENLILKILQLFDETSHQAIRPNQTHQVAIRHEPSQKQQVTVRSELIVTFPPRVTRVVQPPLYNYSLPQNNQTSITSSSNSPNQSNFSGSMYRHKVNENVSNTDLQLSLEFIKWYFPLINSGIQNPNNNEWSCNHFWPDCNLKLSITKPGMNIEESYDDAALTFSKLDCLVKQEGILFNVNETPNGHRGAINPYGMAKVVSCGTIHRFTNGVISSNNVGLFKQLFGLIRDPGDNNRWKIKSTQLFLHLQDNCNADGLIDFIKSENFD